MIGGIAVDQGAIILVASWLLHRHRAHWDHPDEFRPERFLPGARPVNKFAYIPFGAGPRVCLGQHFALTEMVLCIATLAQRYKLQLKQNHIVEIECRPMIKPKGGLPMFVQHRSNR